MLEYNTFRFSFSRVGPRFCIRAGGSAQGSSVKGGINASQVVRNYASMTPALKKNAYQSGE